MYYFLRRWRTGRYVAICTDDFLHLVSLLNTPESSSGSRLGLGTYTNGGHTSRHLRVDIGRTVASLDLPMDKTRLQSVSARFLWHRSRGMNDLVEDGPETPNENPNSLNPRRL